MWRVDGFDGTERYYKTRIGASLSVCREYIKDSNDWVDYTFRVLTSPIQFICCLTNDDDYYEWETPAGE